MRGRKPKPAALRKGTVDAPQPPDALPRCPPHLDAVARKEWRRLATPLYEMGVLTVADRGAFAAYCQAWSRWVEAEEQLRKTPLLLKTPSGYVQQSPWLSIANKQMELMCRYMGEMGLTPAARLRVAVRGGHEPDRPEVFKIIIGGPDGPYHDLDGNEVEDTGAIHLPPHARKV
jgi:P27 family predicted phage terminase small subunit